MLCARESRVKYTWKLKSKKKDEVNVKWKVKW